MPRGIFKHKKGYHLTEEWRKKISEANTGKKHSEESKRKNRIWHLGKISILTFRS